MRQLGLCLLFIIVLNPGGVLAQSSYIESVEEITAGNVAGIGARQMAMGGTGLMAIDGTSLFYNPANLARIPRIEFMFGLSNQKYKNKSSVLTDQLLVDTLTGLADINNGYRFEGFTSLSGGAEDDKTNTRVNNLILTIPYPTYRGSLVIGLGVARLADFDRVFNFAHRDRSLDGDIYSSGREFQAGSLMQWSGGFGVDLSPRISVGASISLYTGTNDYDFTYQLDSVDYLYFKSEQFITDKYLGIGGKVGMAMQVNHYLAFGVTIESPTVIDIDEDYTLRSTTVIDGFYLPEDGYNGSINYNLKKPFTFAMGVQLEKNNAVFEADIGYTDWAQMSYSDNPDMEQENKNIKDFYRDVLRYSLGVEYVIPSWSLSFRGGLFRDPLPFHDQFVNDNRNGYSLGFGVLIDQVLTIDFAYVHGSYGRNSNFWYGTASVEGRDYDHYLIMDEDISYNRIYLTVASRF
jgi:hypothetical protein